MNKFKGFLLLLIPTLILVTIVYYGTMALRGDDLQETAAKQENDTQKNTGVTQGTEDIEQEETPPAPSSSSEKEPESITEEDIAKTKEMAKQFSKAFYNYDANDPLSYLETSKPYMTYEFYEHEKDNPRRNPLDKVKTKAQEIEIYKVDNESEYEIVWNAFIIGETTASDGSKNIEEKSLWIIFDEDEEWKVKGAKFDVW